MINPKSKRSIYILFIILFFGAICGSILSQFVSSVIPDGVVREFFLSSQSFGWGANENNWVDLGVLRFKSGFYVDISIASIIGMMVSWYFLRYFKQEISLGLGPWEIIIIFVVVLLLFGGKKLPEFARGLGEGIKEFKKATNDIKDEVDNAINEKKSEEKK